MAITGLRGPFLRQSCCFAVASLLWRSYNGALCWPQCSPPLDVVMRFIDGALPAPVFIPLGMKLVIFPGRPKHCRLPLILASRMLTVGTGPATSFAWAQTVGLSWQVANVLALPCLPWLGGALVLGCWLWPPFFPKRPWWYAGFSEGWAWF